MTEEGFFKNAERRQRFVGDYPSSVCFADSSSSKELLLKGGRKNWITRDFNISMKKR